MLCKHCGIRKASRPRGLCHRDYYQPGIREKTPKSSHHGAIRSGMPLVGSGAIPDKPTVSPRGSLERMKELARRAERGESLHHPQDSDAIYPEFLRPCDDLPVYHGGSETGLEETVADQDLLAKCIDETHRRGLFLVRSQCDRLPALLGITGDGKGRFVAIEVLEASQPLVMPVRLFIDRIRTNGGIAGVVRSASQLKRVLDAELKNKG